MKKTKHKFVRKDIRNSDAVFSVPAPYDGVISFRIKLNGMEYGDYDYYRNNNFYSRMRTLVMKKQRIVEEYEKIKGNR